MTEAAPPPARRRQDSSLDCPHEYAKQSGFLGSWKSPPPSSDPVEAQKKLALLRREYAKQVKEVRRQYAYEMEVQRQEKLRKDEARREAVRVAKEEREAAKAAAAKVAAAERKTIEEEFRQTLVICISVAARSEIHSARQKNAHKTFAIRIEARDHFSFDGCAHQTKWEDHSVLHTVYRVSGSGSRHDTPSTLHHAPRIRLY